MPQVPYNPVPTARPRDIATPTIGINTPPAAFGGAVAAAIEHMGGDISQAGGEIFNRAIAMEQLVQENEANKAQTQQAVESGQAFSKYSTLEGKAAYDAYPSFQKELVEIRQRNRANLTSPYAQRLYDADSRNVMVREMVNAASHSATQFKQWTIQEGNGVIENAENYVRNNAHDEKSYQQLMPRVEAAARRDVELHQYGPEEGQAVYDDKIAKFKANYIEGKAKIDPPAARKLFDEEKGTLGKYADQLDARIKTNEYNTGARNISSQVMLEVSKKDLSLPDAVNMARDKAREQSPDDSVFADQAEKETIAKYRLKEAVDKGKLDKNMDVIDQAIGSGSVHTVDDLRKSSPEAEDAYWAIPSKQRNGLQGRINTYNNALKQKTNEVEYQRLLGMKDDNPTSFQAADIMANKQLSQSDIRKLRHLQQESRDDPKGDPHVALAYKAIRASLPDNFDDKDQEGLRQQFKGALGEAITVETEQKGKRLNYKELGEIGKNVLHEFVTQPNWFMRKIMGEGPSISNLDVPNEAVEAIKRDWSEEGKAEPTDEEVRREWWKQNYKTLYKKPATFGERFGGQ